MLALLFATGLLSMAMEVVWVRQFTPFLGSLVYAFASILATYLLATFAGSAIYRGWSARRPGEQTGPLSWMAAGTLALAPLACADPYAPLPWGLPLAELRIALGIAPVAAAFGFLTPMLVDRFSAGDPDRAGRAYAVNVIGCILGPLLACFALMPAIGERGTIIACALPLFAIGLVGGGLGSAVGSKPRVSKPAAALVLAVAAALVLLSRDYGSVFRNKEVRRDSTGTAIATGRGRTKRLYVNGTAITSLTPITKVMLHLPMAWRRQPPRDVLVICFGMGTSFRSALAWGVPSTAVELAPAVPELFHWFHPDAEQVLRRPEGKIVIDDGRRYLERTPFQYDVITVDPPPPVEAAGSSLLYSREFYQLVKKRLRKGGVLQQWSPTTDRWTLASIVRALEDEFPHVRGFAAFDDRGVHFLASEEPLEDVSAAELSGRLPPGAAADLVEWGPFQTAEQQFQALLSREVALDVDAFAPGAPALTDDRPMNEYYLLRRLFGDASR
jgi:predicted membrane-bound spermidine synthase